MGTVVSAYAFQTILHHWQDATPTRFHIRAKKDSLMPSVALVTPTTTIAAKQNESPATAATIPATPSGDDTGDHPHQIPENWASLQTGNPTGNVSGKKAARFRQNLRQQFRHPPRPILTRAGGFRGAQRLQARFQPPAPNRRQYDRQKIGNDSGNVCRAIPLSQHMGRGNGERSASLWDVHLFGRTAAIAIGDCDCIFLSALAREGKLYCVG